MISGSMIKSPVGRVRMAGMIEAVSFLILLGIAMPLKYMAGMPEAVTVVGWAHGILFMILCGTLLQAWVGRHLSFWQCVGAFIAALLPFGPFVYDRKLRQVESGG